MPRYKLSIEILDEGYKPPLDSTEAPVAPSMAAYTVTGQYLGFLLAYMINAMEPHMSHDEQEDFAYDMLDGLPDEHPCRKRVRYTNRNLGDDIPSDN